MNVLVTGGTGFVGNLLVNLLCARNDRVTIVTRHPENARTARAGVTYERWLPDVSRFDAIVHLAGEPVVGKRWDAEQKEKIRSSRVDTTRNLVDLMRTATKKPRVFVCGSATGYYGDRGDELLPESAKPGDAFLSSVCVAWETEAARAEEIGVRAVSIRTGIVLGASGGALAKMLPLFKLGLGGPFGSGRAWFPWVHIHDLCDLMLHAIDIESARGAFNGTAPGVVRNKDFARTLGRVLSRPAILPVPKLALKIALGEVATFLTDSQRCVPEHALASGFRFKHPDLEPALRNLLHRTAPENARHASRA
jgi:uncharacterized protein (TIGR01777 family)